MTHILYNKVFNIEITSPKRIIYHVITSTLNYLLNISALAIRTRRIARIYETIQLPSLYKYS